MMPLRLWFPMAERKAVWAPEEGMLLSTYFRIRNGKPDDSRGVRRHKESIYPPSESPFPQLPFRCLAREELLWADRNRSDTQLWEPMH